MIYNVVILGAGNVAWNLGRALNAAGIRILQVYSRSEGSARDLGTELSVPFCHSLADVVPGADLYLIMVCDDAISEVATALPFRDALVVHTAGSVSLSILSEFCRSGVLYPLQTFSKAHRVEFSTVPCFVEGSSPEVSAQIQKLARHLSPMVYEADSQRRQCLHLSAVWGCNFVNHLWGVAADILRKEHLPFGMLRPLMEVTMQKALDSGNPHLVQTGPAVRGDCRVMEKHLHLLENDREIQQLYRQLSESIKKKSYDV